MPRRFCSAPTFALMCALTVAGTSALSGCAALTSPTDSDRAAWRTWFDAAMADDDGAAVGSAFSDDDSRGIPIAPTTSYRSVELRCIGADRATFTLTYTTAAGDTTLTQEIICHGGDRLTPIAIPTAAQELTRFAASAISPGTDGYWVAALQK